MTVWNLSLIHILDANIMKSVENINLDACLGYVKDGVRRHFMDEYDER